MIAGPTTLWSILTSLQMGFRTLAIQKRSSEVWSVLGEAKTEFRGAYWKSTPAWYEEGGNGHVAPYLAEPELSCFNPNAPPPKAICLMLIPLPTIPPPTIPVLITAPGVPRYGFSP